MATTYFDTVDGEIIGESSGSTTINYATDALGSVTGTLVGGHLQNTYAYKPYGALLAKTGTGADPKMQWVGALGYRPTGRAQSDYYVRARHLGTVPGRWATVDSAFPSEPPYSYALDSPTSLADATGYGPGGYDEFVWEQMTPYDALNAKMDCYQKVNLCHNACTTACLENQQCSLAADIAGAATAFMACEAFVPGLGSVCAGWGWNFGGAMAAVVAGATLRQCLDACDVEALDRTNACIDEYKRNIKGYWRRRSCDEVAEVNCAYPWWRAITWGALHPQPISGSPQPGGLEPLPNPLLPPELQPRPRPLPRNPWSDYYDCVRREKKACLRWRKKRGQKP